MNEFLQTLISLGKKTLQLITEQLAAASNAATTQTTPPAPEAPKPASPEAEETKPVEVETPIVVETPKETAPVNKPVAAIISTTSVITTDNLPQDSIQRRHVLAHLKNILETVKGARPSDSIQSRHYDAEINSQIALSLVCKKTLANAYTEYEVLAKQTKPVITPVAETTVAPTAAPLCVSVVPTDSILRRHYEALQNS